MFSATFYQMAGRAPWEILKSHRLGFCALSSNPEVERKQRDHKATAHCVLCTLPDLDYQRVQLRKA